MFVFAEMRDATVDRGKGLVLKCAFEDQRWMLKLDLGFQLHVGRVGLMVYEDQLRLIQIVICVLPDGLESVGSPGHLQARALLVASVDSGTRRMAVTRPLIERRPHRRAAERVGDAGQRLQIE